MSKLFVDTLELSKKLRERFGYTQEQADDAAQDCATAILLEKFGGDAVTSPELQWPSYRRGTLEGFLRAFRMARGRGPRAEEIPGIPEGFEGVVSRLEGGDGRENER